MRERDVLKLMSLVLAGHWSQGEAGGLIGRSERQVRRLLRRLEAEGDAGVIPKMRGWQTLNHILTGDHLADREMWGKKRRTVRPYSCSVVSFVANALVRSGPRPSRQLFVRLDVPLPRSLDYVVG